MRERIRCDSSRHIDGALRDVGGQRIHDDYVRRRQCKSATWVIESRNEMSNLCSIILFNSGSKSHKQWPGPIEAFRRLHNTRPNISKYAKRIENENKYLNSGSGSSTSAVVSAHGQSCCFHIAD